MSSSVEIFKLFQVRSKAQKILNDYTASVSVSQKAKISCEPGYEFKIPNGSKEQKCCEYPFKFEMKYL